MYCLETGMSVIDLKVLINQIKQVKYNSSLTNNSIQAIRGTE